MTPDIEQLHRIRASAVKAGLKLRTVDADPFVAAYMPRLYRQYMLPPSFVWLCTICDPDQLARIWIEVAGTDDLGPIARLNDELRREPVLWPEHLVAFAMTGDESFCFAYNSPDAEPAIVTVDSYARHLDEDEEPYVNWDWYADNFEQWLLLQADWLPQADAKIAAWHAEFIARKNAEAR
jgi:hypothetical protein